MTANIPAPGPYVHTLRQISVAADFFHAYPRLFNASKTFATTETYRTGLYKLAIPYLSTALTLILLTLLANFYFYTRRGVVPGVDDTHESDPHRRDNVGRAFLLFSCFLNLGVILCIGIAFASAFTMRHAAQGAHDVLRAAHVNISLQVTSPARMVHDLAVRVADVDITTVPPDVTDPVIGVKQIFERRTPAVDALLDGGHHMFEKLAAIEDQLQYLSTRFFWFTFAVLACVVLALILSFVCDATTPDSKKLRLTTFSLLLLPLAATWTHIAISTWVAVASGDFCQSVEEYHRAVLSDSAGATPNLSPSNLFADFNLTCPRRTPAVTGLRALNGFLGDTVGYEFFDTGFAALTDGDITSEAWASTRDWIQDRLAEFEGCATQVVFAGHLSYYMCGDHGRSAMSAVGQLWLCSFGLALLCTVIVGLLTLGHPPSEFVAAREMMHLYGAPKLISVFEEDDVLQSDGSRYGKLESGLSAAKKISPSSSVSDSSSAVSKGCSEKDSESTVSSGRPRKDL